MEANGARFTDTVKVEWLESDRRLMKILKPFAFIDAEGEYWHVPTNSIIDGASIPKFFWMMIGSPFIGNYRRASVIHDIFCKNKRRTCKLVHKMFYEAMLVDYVTDFKAKVMYNAVKKFGPQW